MPQTNYAGQRPEVTPPHVSLAALRGASGLTLDEVCDRINEHLNPKKPFRRGSLSAIENGIRGASQEVLRALEVAYGLRPGDITTTYEPMARRLSA